MLGLVFSLLAGCNMPNGEASSSPTINVTQAYETVAARLTESAATPSPSPLAQPSATLLASATLPALAPTTAAAATATQAPPANTPTAQKLCDQAAAGSPIDVTIPDNTVLQPGQAFNKIWRLVNVGTCTWETSYAAVFFSGEQMSAPAVVSLKGQVAPGQSVDISVDMVAPLAAGKYQGNWKLRNAASVLFGIGPNSSAPFWVLVQVLATTTATVSPSPSSGPPTVTPTPTATTTSIPVQASGGAQLDPNDTLDLDSNQVNSPSGQDLLYQLITGSQYQLVPQGSAALAVYGSTRPNLNDCQADDLTQSPLRVDNLSSGTYLCYRTDQGRPGWMRLAGFDTASGVLSVEILTWAVP